MNKKYIYSPIVYTLIFIRKIQKKNCKRSQKNIELSRFIKEAFFAILTFIKNYILNIKFYFLIFDV